MSTTDGARPDAGDPVLDGALAEMAAAGEFNATATFADPAPVSASPTSGTESAAPAAVPAPSAGDSGSESVAAPTTAGPQGTAPVQSAGTPAADPLAGTEPFAYTVNGQEQKLAWAHRVPGEGLLLTEAEVPQFQQLVEREALLDRAHRDLTEQHSTLERLSTWTVPGPDGKDQTITGQAGLIESHAAHARKDALIAVVDSILTDPAKLISLLAKDETGRIVVDPTAVETLQMRAQLAADGAEKSARAKLGAVVSPPPSPASGPAANYAAQAPGLIKQAAGANLAALAPEDHTELAADLSRYIRGVTEEDRKYNPTLKLGAPIVDASFGARVGRLASIRAASKQAAVAAETAGKHNAATERGRQPAKAAPKVAAPAKPADAPSRKKADWDSPFTDAMGELGIPVR